MESPATLLKETSTFLRIPSEHFFSGQFQVAISGDFKLFLNKISCIKHQGFLSGDVQY